MFGRILGVACDVASTGWAAWKLPVATVGRWPGHPVGGQRRQQSFEQARAERLVFEATNLTYRPGAVLTSARLNVRKRSLSDCIPQQRRQAHYRPRRRPGGHGSDSRGAVLSRIDQYEARHATAKVTTSTVPGSDRSWCKRNTVTLPDRCSRFSSFELPISLARRRTAAPTPRSTGWAQRLSSRQIQVPQGLAERTVESARIQPVQLGRGRYTTRTQASGLLCPAAACRRVWRSTVRTSKISIL